MKTFVCCDKVHCLHWEMEMSKQILCHVTEFEVPLICIKLCIEYYIIGIITFNTLIYENAFYGLIKSLPFQDVCPFVDVIVKSLVEYRSWNQYPIICIKTLLRNVIKWSGTL